MRKQLVMPAAKQYVLIERKHCLEPAAREMTVVGTVAYCWWFQVMDTHSKLRRKEQRVLVGKLCFTLPVTAPWSLQHDQTITWNCPSGQRHTHSMAIFHMMLRIEMVFNIS